LHFSQLFLKRASQNGSFRPTFEKKPHASVALGFPPSTGHGTRGFRRSRLPTATSLREAQSPCSIREAAYWRRRGSGGLDYSAAVAERSFEVKAHVAEKPAGQAYSRTHRGDERCKAFGLKRRGINVVLGIPFQSQQARAKSDNCEHAAMIASTGSQSVSILQTPISHSVSRIWR
jgi:hypothetical protein